MGKIDYEELKRIVKENNGVDVEFITETQPFDFDCDQCGKCCKNETIKSIILRPYDIYRLAKGLNKKPVEIVKESSNQHIGSSSGFPILTLKSFWNGRDHICPFLKQVNGKGQCMVNDFKPGVCRLFPLGRLSMAEKDSSSNILYFNQEVTCGNRGKLHSIDEWMGNSEYKKTEESVLTKDSDFMSRVRDTMILSKLHELGERFPPAREAISELYSRVSVIYYMMYETDKDFIPQFEYNMAQIEREITDLALELLCELGPDYPEEVFEFIKKEVIAKDFEKKNERLINLFKLNCV